MNEPLGKTEIETKDWKSWNKRSIGTKTMNEENHLYNFSFDWHSLCRFRLATWELFSVHHSRRRTSSLIWRGDYPTMNRTWNFHFSGVTSKCPSFHISWYLKVNEMYFEVFTMSTSKSFKNFWYFCEKKRHFQVFMRNNEIKDNGPQDF